MELVPDEVVQSVPVDPDGLRGALGVEENALALDEVVGLIRSRGQCDYAAALTTAARSNSAGEAYPMAECIRCWL